MTVKIHGKDYRTVVERVNLIHTDYPDDIEINLELVKFDEKVVITKAIVKKHVGEKIRTFSDYAYEKIGSTKINETSALENCCTSAIGRALAAAGYGGEQYASAEEVQNAVKQQESGDNPSYTIKKLSKSTSDDFDFSSDEESSESATEKQLSFMRWRGIQFDETKAPTKAEASSMIDKFMSATAEKGA